MNERIKKLRKALNLTQQDFASKIGSVQNTITGYETGRRVPSNQVIALICREFSVSETWLRTGEGDMFIQRSRESELTAFVNDLLAEESDSFRARLVTALARLKPEQWDALETVTQEIMKSTSAASPDPAPAAISVMAPASENTERARLEKEADAFAAMAREQFLSEKIQERQVLSAKESGAG